MKFILAFIGVLILVVLGMLELCLRVIFIIITAGLVLLAMRSYDYLDCFCWSLADDVVNKILPFV